ncbi:MAG: flagellar assembly peptidoglycan hydrolase FlgJ [Propionivibrio sp.]|uniref:flagellar assembly peptidoglycan hydrolase FlgJ n=1 Tax=Propionivibrio sp. TaxID=2212460 RepID=UPI001A62026B|nr:flagellar assembly peptidoglycan hydrolase FlgJ [Propionivibrio sp.]MBL8413370.1 flagellar assembly peptidoglycan hydrolase FlgJ [Propionivibrio sp.]
MKAENLDANHFVLDPKTTADLRVNLKKDPQGGAKQVAQQFEGMLLQMMLKSMRDATPQDGLLDSDQTRFFTSIMDQQLAQNLSARGSLGFAKLIEQQLGRNQANVSGKSDAAVSSLEVMQQALLARQTAPYSGAGAERIRSAPAAGSESAESAGASGGASDFVNRVWPHAVEAANGIGVPPQFLVAHSALESGWGKSEIKTANGSPSYNLFGVKAGRSWQGPSVEVQTTEYVDGVAQSSREKFRVYGSYAEAFRDYASLLKNNPRFSAVLGQKDGTQFARSLQQSGYATDPMYADKLSRIINGTTLRLALVS